jgi:translin
MTNLDTIAESILERLEAKNQAREEVLAHSRHLVQHAARAIRALHRGETATSDEILQRADEIAAAMRRAGQAHPDIVWAGYTQDAFKEYAEAHLTRALALGHDLPSPDELQVEDAAYINGLGEAVGELRRLVLDLIRRGEVERAEPILDAMQEIYVFLSTVDFPSAITGNIKRTNDMVRNVTERTSGDLTMAVRQEELQRALEAMEERLTGDWSGPEADSTR